jgi:hypothetical protein
MTTADLLQAIASVGGLALAAVGLPLLYRQLVDVQRSVRGSAHAAIYAQAADVRAHLVEHPHLRRFFFDGARIDPDHPEYDRVVTIAELMLNYLEHVTVMTDALGDANRASLDRFCGEILRNAPIVRERLANGRGLYSTALLARLESNADS